MDWHPYIMKMLSTQLHFQIPRRTRLSLLFCFNFVEHHLPHLLARQFEVLEGLNLDDIRNSLELITFKSNRSKNDSNLLKHFEKELLIWNSRLFVERCCMSSHGSPPSNPNQGTAMEPKKTRMRRWLGYVSPVNELRKRPIKAPQGSEGLKLRRK